MFEPCRARLVSQRYVLARYVGVVQAEGDLHADGHKAYDRERRRDGARKTRPESRCDNDYGGIARDSQCTNHRNPRRSQHNTTLESRVYAARPENRSVQPFERAPGRAFLSEGLRPSDSPTRALARAGALAPIAWLLRCAHSRRQSS